jgi:hypothetical protein
LLRVLRSASGTLSLSLRCGDPIRLQGYFCRAGDASGRRTIDPRAALAGVPRLRCSNYPSALFDIIWYSDPVLVDEGLK